MIWHLLAVTKRASYTPSCHKLGRGACFDRSFESLGSRRWYAGTRFHAGGVDSIPEGSRASPEMFILPRISTYNERQPVLI